MYTMKRKGTEEDLVKGKGVQSNDHNNGKWTQEEHERFLHGIEIHGNRWRKVMDCVKTRDCAQIRSHAQKYFRRQRNLKLQDLRKSGRIKNLVFLIMKEYYHYSSSDYKNGIEEKPIKILARDPEHSSHNHADQSDESPNQLELAEPKEEGFSNPIFLLNLISDTMVHTGLGQ